MSGASKRGRRARGIALADFITGSVILAGAVTAWAGITRAQIDSAAYSHGRAQARCAALQALDAARLENGAAAFADLKSAADKDGFRLVRTFEVPNVKSATAGEPAGRLEARPLRVDGASAGGPAVYELRALVVWRGEKGTPDRLEISTALAGGAP